MAEGSTISYMKTWTLRRRDIGDANYGPSPCKQIRSSPSIHYCHVLRLCAVRGATTHLRFRTSTPTDESMSEHGILLSLTIICKKKEVMNATENLIRGSEKNTRKSILDRAYHHGTNERA